MASAAEAARKPSDHIPRGAHGYHWSRTLFALLRPLDPLACYALLRYRGLDASPRHLLLTGLIGLGALRQSFWSLALHPHPLTVGLAVQVYAYNQVLDLIWALVSCYAMAPGPLGPLQYAVLALNLLGGFLETYSEVQRKRFKDAPHNAGKLHTTGLFSVVQHINYLGYILWRLSLGLGTGSLLAALVSLHNLADFYFRGVPALQAYLQSRYAAQKIEYDRKTPYKLIPYIW